MLAEGLQSAQEEMAMMVQTAEIKVVRLGCQHLRLKIIQRRYSTKNCIFLEDTTERRTIAT